MISTRASSVVGVTETEVLRGPAGRELTLSLSGRLPWPGGPRGTVTVTVTDTESDSVSDTYSVVTDRADVRHLTCTDAVTHSGLMTSVRSVRRCESESLSTLSLY